MNREIVKQREYWDKEVEYFDSIYTHSKSNLSNWLDKKFRWDMYARFNYTIDNSEPIEGSTILDVGCGTGLYSLKFGQLKAKKVIGIDISTKMIDVCKQRTANENLTTTCEFYTTDLLTFHNQNNFDVVIGIGLFDYIKEPGAVVNEMKRKCCGKTILSFPKAGTLRAFIRKIRLTMKGCDVYFYSKQKIDDLLKSAGFVRYDLKVVGQLYCVTAYVK